MDIKIDRATVSAALALDGFEQWTSKLDSSLLHRPASRPAELSGTGRTAAVMALLIDASEAVSTAGPELLLIRRSRNLKHHAGQMAFPGGRQDAGEKLRTTSVRETREEIGVSLQMNDIVGKLQSVYLPPSDFTLTPFVAWLNRRPAFTLQTSEVEEVITVPMAAFLDVDHCRIEPVVRDNGQTIEAPCYRIDQHVIWGATALVISELVARLEVVLARA